MVAASPKEKLRLTIGISGPHPLPMRLLAIAALAVMGLLTECGGDDHHHEHGDHSQEHGEGEHDHQDE